MITLINYEYECTSDSENKNIDILKQNKGRVKFEKINKIPNVNNLIYKMQNKDVIDVKWEYKDYKNEKKTYLISLSKEIDRLMNI